MVSALVCKIKKRARPRLVKWPQTFQSIECTTWMIQVFSHAQVLGELIMRLMKTREQYDVLDCRAKGTVPISLSLFMNMCHIKFLCNMLVLLPEPDSSGFEQAITVRKSAKWKVQHLQNRLHGGTRRFAKELPTMYDFEWITAVDINVLSIFRAFALNSCQSVGLQNTRHLTLG